MSEETVPVLLVEDNPGDATLIREYLRDVDASRFSLVNVARLKEALELLEHGRWGAILLDLSLPDSCGLETLDRVRLPAPDVPVVILTGNHDERLAMEAIQKGAQDYLVKGQLDGQVLTRALRYAIERARSEREFDQQARIMESVFNSMGDGVLVVDGDGQVLLVNKEAERIIGGPFPDRLDEEFAQVIGIFRTDCKTLVRAEELSLSRAIRGQKVDNEEFFIRNENIPQGRFIRVTARPLLSSRGEIRGGVTMLRDVTETRTLEQQLQHSQRMESVGRLAGGIAHDFNNILMVINGYASMIAARLPDDQGLRDDLSEVIKAGDRAAALTGQLLAFSRKQVMEPKIVSPAVVLNQMEKMLKRLLGEDIELRLDLDPSTGQIKVDVGQVEQVLMNLGANARDAMPDGGELTIHTKNVELEKGQLPADTKATPGSFVSVELLDTGEGMDEGTIENLFEPFFTTKERGKGTGLGLATVFGIVRQSGGHINVTSSPGKGTTFQLLFPRAFQSASVPSGKKSEARTGTKEETVLLVEDEDAVRTLVSRILKKHGYTVLAAPDGKRAMEAATSHSGPIDVLLTDVIMPGTKGPVLARQIRESRPSVRVIYISGYQDDAVVRDSNLEEGTRFLSKPVDEQSILNALREVLEHKEDV